jgi:hypothetical protein
MEKMFENVTRITTKSEYDAVMKQLDAITVEAITGGHLAIPDIDNEYRREIARLGCLGGRYESDFMKFNFETTETAEHSSKKRQTNVQWTGVANKSNKRANNIKQF